MRLLINEPPLQVLPSLAVAIGLNEAIVLQQLHYWLMKSTIEVEGQRWVYNTIGQWLEQFPFWSPRTIERTLASLVNSGYVARRQLAVDPRDRTNYYTINRQNVAAMPPKWHDEYRQIDGMEPAKMAACSIEQETTTTETTQRGGTEVPAPRTRKRLVKRTVDGLVIAELMAEFGPQLAGGDAAVRAAIEAALNHTASDKWKDPVLGVRGWLRRDVEREKREGKRGGFTGVRGTGSDGGVGGIAARLTADDAAYMERIRARQQGAGASEGRSAAGAAPSAGTGRGGPAVLPGAAADGAAGVGSSEVESGDQCNAGF